MQITNAIIAYEEGTLELNETLELFAELIKTNMAWTLQGHYGRTAAALIEEGYIDRKGSVNWDAVNEVYL